MNKKTLLPLLTLISAVAALASGCVIAERDGGRRDDRGRHEEQYREGYYDRDRHRYYHEHEWHECRDGDDRCR